MVFKTYQIVNLKKLYSHIPFIIGFFKLTITLIIEEKEKIIVKKLLKFKNIIERFYLKIERNHGSLNRIKL